MAKVTTPTKSQLKGMYQMGFNGMDFTLCGSVFGVATSTFFERSKKYPEIKDTYLTGKRDALSELVAVTHKRAMNCSRKDASDNAKFLINRADRVLERELGSDSMSMSIVVKSDDAIKLEIVKELS